MMAIKFLKPGGRGLAALGVYRTAPALPAGAGLDFQNGSGAAQAGDQGRGSAVRSDAAPVLAIAETDREFLRFISKASGARRLSRYAAAAPLLAEAEASAGAAAPWSAALIALGLPDLNGVIAIARLKALHPGMKIWAMAGVEESHTLLGAICAGADGYLIKRLSMDGVVADFGAFNADQPPLGSRLAVSLLKLAGDLVWGRPAPVPVELPPRLGLSRLQLQLLKLVAYGDTVAAAAARMGLSEAKGYECVREIYRALQQPALSTAVPQALRAQMLGPSPATRVACELNLKNDTAG